MISRRKGLGMPRQARWLFMAAVLLSLGFWKEASASSQARTLLEMMATEEASGSKVSIIGDGDFSRYKVSGLREPARIVIDLFGVENYKFNPASLSPTREIERVRVARHNDKVRVVLDLNPEALPVPYDVRREPGKLTVSLGFRQDAQESLLESPDEREFQGEKEQPQEEDKARWDIPPSEARYAGIPRSWEEATPSIVEPPRILDPKASERKEMERPSVDVAENSGNVIGKPKEDGHELEKWNPPQRDIVWVDPRVDIQKKKQGTFLPKEARIQPAAFSMAQVAKKPLPKAPAVSIQEEEEEEFKISTGMEPGKTYTGQKLDLDLQDIDLDNVFRLIAEVSNLNIIVSEKVKGKVTMRLKEVPWDQALDLILSTHKLGMIQQGNVVRIAPLKDLLDEEKERKRVKQERLQAKIEAAKRLQEAEIEAQERERKLRPFVTEFITLNYTKAKDFQAQIKDILTKEPKLERVGTAVVDERTNTVTITDYPEKIERIKQYKEKVDKPTPQVLIEARIVKATKNFARELGVQWGAQYAEYDKRGEWAWGVSSATGSGTTPPVTPSSWQSGSFTQGTGRDFFPLSGWMVNLPATLLPTPPGIGLQVGRLVGDLINLDLRLSAAEREGLTKIISRPKVMTLDNVEATIKQGREIPFTQVNPEGNVSVVYKEASLKTTVTPQISPDGRVRLKLDVTDDFPDRSNANPITGNPEIVKRQGTTEVLVRDGETVVIGGVLEETRATAEDGVPWLKDLPGLNWFFERKTRRHDQTELLIFVTPFIVQQD